MKYSTTIKKIKSKLKSKTKKKKIMRLIKKEKRIY